MALAIYFDELIRTGQVENYAELAKIGRVSRARVTQIMGLLNLAPGLQECLLESAGSRASERDLRRAVASIDWSSWDANDLPT
jgi:hypothetical protein